MRKPTSSVCIIFKSPFSASACASKSQQRRMLQQHSAVTPRESLCCFRLNSFPQNAPANRVPIKENTVMSFPPFRHLGKILPHRSSSLIKPHTHCTHNATLIFCTPKPWNSVLHIQYICPISISHRASIQRSLSSFFLLRAADGQGEDYGASTGLGAIAPLAPTSFASNLAISSASNSNLKMSAFEAMREGVSDLGRGTNPFCKDQRSNT